LIRNCPTLSKFTILLLLVKMQDFRRWKFKKRSKKMKRKKISKKKCQNS
jgi:hypothetical protein